MARPNFKSFALASLVLWACPFCVEAWAGMSAADKKECIANNRKAVKSVDEQFKAFGIKPENPCPEQDRYDDSNRNCQKAARKLDALDKKLTTLYGKKCENAEKLRKLPGEADGKNQKKYQDNNTALMKEADSYLDQENEILNQMKGELKAVRDHQIKIAEGARDIQQRIEDKAGQDPQGKDEHVAKLDKAGKARGVTATNNEQAKSFFRDSLSTVSDVLDRSRSSRISREDVNQIQTPLTREPLAVAAAADDWDDQIEKRQAILKSQKIAFGGSGSTTTGNSKSLGENKAASSSAGENGAGGSGGAAGGGSDAAGTMGGAAQAMQAASGLAGAAGGGSGSAGGSADTGAYGASSGYETASYAPTSAEAAGSAKSNRNGGQSSGGKNLGNIENLDKVIKTADAAGPDAKGASTAPKGTSLRETLRDRLNQNYGDGGGGGGGSTGASMAGGAGSGTGAGASSGAVTPDLLPEAVPIASDNPLEASTGSVGGDLGNTDFSLAGSDTDAAVKGMLKDFGVGEESAGDRGPASETHASAAPEILNSDSPSLFFRTREVHQRSLKKGLVINGLRAKL